MTDPGNADSNNSRQIAAKVSTRPRWPRRLLMIVVGIVIVLVLTVTLAPSYVARYLLAAQLDALGIAHHGLQTLELKLLQGRVAIGPLTLGIDQEVPARLARFEAIVDMQSLLANRISIEKVSLRGVELHMSPAAEGGVAVNVMQAEALPGAALVRGLLQGELLTFAVGVESVELVDSRLLVQTVWGGHLDIALQRLALSGFRGWQVEHPMSFQLEARLNDMLLRLDGDATPLLAEPSLRVETFVDEVTVERIARLAKGAKPHRAKGTYRVSSSHELSMARSGELSGRSKGELTLKGADYAVPGLFEASGKQLQAGFATDYRLPPGGGWNLAGHAAMSLDDVQIGGPEQARLGIRALRWNVNDVQSSSDASGNGRLQLSSDLQADDAGLRGQLRLSVGMVIYLLRALQFVAAGVDADTFSGNLDSWGSREVRLPATDLTVARLHSKGQRLQVASDAQGVTLTFNNVVEASGIRARSGKQSTDAESLRLSIPNFRLTHSLQGTALETGLAASASSVKAIRDAGEGAFDTIETAVSAAQLKVTSDSFSGRFAGHADITQVTARVKGQPGLPAADFTLDSGRITLGEATASATLDSATWQLSAALQSKGMGFNLGEPASARAAVAGIDVAGIQIDQTGTIAMDSIALQGVDAAMLGSHFLLELSLHTGASVRVAQTQPQQQPNTKPTAVAAAAQGAPGAEVSLQRIQGALLERGFDPGPLDGLMGRRTVAAIKALQASKGLTEDGLVSDVLLQALELSSRPASEPVEAQTEPGPPIRFRIGALALAKGAKFHYSDDTVEPDVDVELIFDTLSLKNLDTQDPGQRLQVDVSAAVNEFAQMEIKGSLAPLREPLDLDLKVALTNMELSPFASYTDRYLGLSIDEGQLGTDSSIVVHDGALDVQLELDIWRLQVRPLSAEDEKKIADVLGVSVVTAMRLVKDAEGRIELSIPIGGTVDEPDVDVSDAVNKAIGGVVVALLPTTWIADLFAENDQVDFEPVVFDGGSNELSEVSRGNLDRLAEAMLQYPDVVLTVCGRATGADDASLRLRGATDDRMAAWGGALAVERTRAVRSYLVKEKDLPIRRVTECRADYSASDPKPPRVEISL